MLQEAMEVLNFGGICTFVVVVGGGGDDDEVMLNVLRCQLTY